ncbi:MAG: methionyl-tRNA formyltransferase [Opitutus sp.]|nr:methionyl-tRNA formyltransferase [Opitutus sp.]
MRSPLRLVFFGSDPIALPLLDWLATEGAGIADVVAVWTQPDRAVGRGQNIVPNAIKSWAAARGLPVFQPEKLTDDVRLQLAALRADLGLVMAYGHILRDDFIGTPRLGMFNLHTSLLPRLRGASPIQTAIASGVRETGVTLMRIVRRLDAGPVADVERVAVGDLDTAADVESKLAVACVPLVARALPRLADGTLTFTPQDDAAATYCRKLGKDDGAVDFAAPAAVLAARINGLFPWPSCMVEINGQPVKLGLADVAPATEASGSGAAMPGEVVGADGHGLRVATGEGVLRLRKLQRPGGRMLPAADFLRGFAVAIGTRIPSRPMPVLVTRR